MGIVSPVLQSQLFNTHTILLQVGFFHTYYPGDTEFVPFTHLNGSAVPSDADTPTIGIVWDTEFGPLGDLGIDGEDLDGVKDMGLVRMRFISIQRFLEIKRLCSFWSLSLGRS
jgi:hypothetical protein